MTPEQVKQIVITTLKSRGMKDSMLRPVSSPNYADLIPILRNGENVLLPMQWFLDAFSSIERKVNQLTQNSSGGQLYSFYEIDIVSIAISKTTDISAEGEEPFVNMQCLFKKDNVEVSYRGNYRVYYVIDNKEFMMSDNVLTGRISIGKNDLLNNVVHSVYFKIEWDVDGRTYTERSDVYLLYQKASTIEAVNTEYIINKFVASTKNVSAKGGVSTSPTLVIGGTKKITYNDGHVEESEITNGSFGTLKYEFDNGNALPDYVKSSSVNLSNGTMEFFANQKNTLNRKVSAVAKIYIGEQLIATSNTFDIVQLADNVKNVYTATKGIIRYNGGNNISSAGISGLTPENTIKIMCTPTWDTGITETPYEVNALVRYISSSPNIDVDELTGELAVGHNPSKNERTLSINVKYCLDDVCVFIKEIEIIQEAAEDVKRLIIYRSSESNPQLPTDSSADGYEIVNLTDGNIDAGYMMQLNRVRSVTILESLDSVDIDSVLDGASISVDLEKGTAYVNGFEHKYVRIASAGMVLLNGDYRVKFKNV